YDVTLDFLPNILLPYIEKFLLNYNLKPSDAIHLATMEKVGIKNIVTEDEDFDKVKEVKRIWLNSNTIL
ncbi:MAG: type II toxin-antitoxin system VapC family toxin, partial [Nitrososphaerota archaeon]